MLRAADHPRTVLAPPPGGTAGAARAAGERAAPPAGAARGVFASLDGLRVAFMAWVLFYHLPIGLLSGPLLHVRQHWSWGVDGFLALSGFLAARSLVGRDPSQLLDPVQRRARLREFLARRFARIAPSYYAMMVVMVVLPLLPTRTLGEELAAVRHVFPSFFVFAANYALLRVPDAPMFMHTWWSMSLQEQFFVLFAIAAVVTRGRPAPLLAVLAIGSLLLRNYVAAFVLTGPERMDAIEYPLHLNVDAMAWGALAWVHYDRLGVLWATRRRAIASTALILLVAALSVALRSWWTGNVSLAVLYSIKYPALALVVRLVCQYDGSDAPVMRLLRSRALLPLSLASFEIYLVHALTYRLALFPGFRSPWAYLALAVSASVIGGMLLHRLWGLPAQRWLRARLVAARPSPSAVAA